MPADSLKTSRNMLTQKVMGYESTSTTLVTLSPAKGRKDDCYAGLFCSGKLFRGIGLSRQGIFVESGGQRTIVRRGQFPQVYLRIKNDCAGNRHQFYYSTDGVTFTEAGEAFPMRAGYWKGIRVGLFCYGDGGKAQFDFWKTNE